MSGNQTPYRNGAQFGFYLAFDKRGDGVSLHKHNEAHRHNVNVVRGSVMIYGEEGPNGSWSQTLQVGDVFDVPADLLHEIVALEDSTLILNLAPNGIPTDYVGLDESEFSGTTMPPTFALST